MSWFKKAVLWFKKYWKWVVGTLTVVFSILSLYFFKDDFTELVLQKKRVSLAKNKKEIEVLKSKRELIKARIDHTEEQVKEVDDQIQKIEKSIEEDRKEILSLSMSEKLDKYDDLGY